jgi:hypothetical protein
LLCSLFKDIYGIFVSSLPGKQTKMPITPDEARRLQSETAFDPIRQLDRDLERVAVEKIDTGQPITLAIDHVPRSAAHIVVLSWREAGWPHARIEKGHLHGNYIRLDR